LTLPTRDPPGPDGSTPPLSATAKYYFALGKAYLTFYKTGLRHIYTNTQLLWYPGTASKEGLTAPAKHTRAHALLQARWSHDIRRLPLFAVLVLVCGEFTPLVVLAVPRIVPFPCRIPAQNRQIARAAEDRRRRARAALPDTTQEADARAGRAQAVCLARSLGVVSPLWDRFLGSVPASLARRRVDAKLASLAADDALIRQAGGVPALEAEEVSLACEQRGLDTQGKSAEEVAERLARWLLLTRGDVVLMKRLLLSEEAEW
jgi:hypothetical protein